ncbi:hypothetical protein LIER_42737 [Lithospermum erythrorhizon]|uniref:Uncharacterized protein n=1 Tax=Lithospermum erythrorhizon TaxID=34254 RepID=A0AAV3NWD9_LITER
MDIEYPDHRSRCWRRKYIRLEDSNRKIKKVRIIKLGKKTRGASRFPCFKLVSPIKVIVGIHDAYIDKMISLTGSKVHVSCETTAFLSNRRRGEGTACWN